MYCNRCGKKIDKKGKYCHFCGNPVPGSGGGKGIVPGIILTLLLVAVIVVGGLLLPVQVTVDRRGQELSSKELVIEDLRLGIKANRPILAIDYALNPETRDKNAYSACELSSGLLKRDLSIDRVEIEPGENTLALRVKTLFGEKECKLTLTGDIGYISIPDETAIVELGAGTSLISNELVLVFKDSAGEEQIRQLIAAYGGEIVGQIYVIGEYHVRFQGSGEDYIRGLKAQLQQEDIVEAVYLNVSFEAEPDYYPNDRGFDSWDVDNPGGNNWGLEAIDAPIAWEYRNELSTVKIGVIDSCIQYDHEDLNINPSHVSILPSNDFQTMEQLLNYYRRNVPTHQHPCYFSENNRCVYCYEGFIDHGIHCTGIIGASHDNRCGIAGVAWNADLYFTTYWYYTTPAEGQLTRHEYSNGIIYNITKLVRSGCRVISMSVGSGEATEEDDDEREAADRFDRVIRELEEQGYDFLICKSAGNNGDQKKHHADQYVINRIMTKGEHAARHVIIVGAVEDNSSITGYDRLVNWGAAKLSGLKKIYNMAHDSNDGDLVRITAPGSNIFSTVFGNNYQNMSGTSMATPMVAGVAGLIYGANPNYTCEQVKSVFQNTWDSCCVKDSRAYPIVNAKKAVEWALEHRTFFPDIEQPHLGFVTGLVQDAQTMILISSKNNNAGVLITNEESQEQYIAPIEDGVYECALSPGNYTMEFFADGYVSETIYHVRIEDGLTEYNVLLNMVTEEPGTGRASGQIINAFDASAVSGATIEVFRGVNQTSGTPLQALFSDSYGRYSLELDPGNYTIRVRAEGFQDGKANILFIPGTDRSDQNCSLTPILNVGEVRMVLTWGAYPDDLDSHLVGPGMGRSFHTYYSDMKYSFNYTVYDMLDVDDTSSYGPETTSIYASLDGNYTYLVHDFTNRDQSFSNALATSGAQVKVYLNGYSDPLVFNVPNQGGTVWTVFSLQNGVVTPINTMSYESDPENVGRQYIP